MSFAFLKLRIPGLFVIRPDVCKDERGFFCETYKKSEFVDNGITADFVQDNHSFSIRSVVRAFHYQLPPCAQGKLVSVISGKIWDVAVDLRKRSPSFGKWVGVELSEENMCMFWIPPGFAHGFVALSESAHLCYKCTAEYDKTAERGIRWDDPDLHVDWPLRDAVVSAKDRGLPAFRDLRMAESL
jgi:dTDP-4-dehydrorhamnose 3,5-epimerase